MPKTRVDKLFLIAILLLVGAGFFIFSSASLGLLAREGISYSTVAIKQIGTIVIGLIIMLIVSKIDYKLWRKYSLPVFVTSFLVTCLVFVPHIGFGHNGAHRWISIGSFLTIQPAEFLKLGAIIYLAAWLSRYRDRVATIRYGLVPFLVISGVIGLLMLKQPDTGTFMVIFSALFGMYIIAGANWKHIGTVILIGIIGLCTIAYFRPYVMARITTFINPAADAYGSGYQIQQALIAVGSGGFFGRGFGQSIQKFKFLPEPIGDSIFAVAGEEFGFFGLTIIIGLFIFFALRGFRIASRAKDSFGGLVTSGLVIMILAGAFINIASMIGIMPLTGVPLSFISHGGTALLFSLIAVGIILNISKTLKKS